MRKCGDCQLCCRLLPMHDNEPWRSGEPINKPANVRCPHQKHGVGCAIYSDRPFACQMWTCRWLTNQDTADLSRPDRSHLVIDVMPDYVTLQDNETGEAHKLQVVQVWCDPRYPDAHRDPAFRRFVERRGEEGIATLIRYDERRAFTLFPPSLAPDGQWHEMHSDRPPEHRTDADMAEFLTGARLGISVNE